MAGSCNPIGLDETKISIVGTVRIQKNFVTNVKARLFESAFVKRDVSFVQISTN